MKKNKKKVWVLFIGIFTMLVGLGAFLTNISNKEKMMVSVSETEPKVSLSATTEGVAAYAASDSDILNYISSRKGQGQLFYPYDLLVNKSYQWDYSYVSDYINTDGTDAELPSTIEFKADEFYIINGVNKSDQEAGGIFDMLYSYDSSKVYQKDLACDANYYYSNDQNYEWDNQEVCASIQNNWKSKVDSIFANSSYDFHVVGTFRLFVPNEDFTATLDLTKISSYPGYYLSVIKAKYGDGDYLAPVIGGTVNLSVNVDNQPSLEEILSHVQAVDETDGIVPITVTSSTYTPGEMKVGEYYINLSATDAAGNTGTGKITLSRFDSTSPLIDGQDYYELNYDHDITLQKILNNLTTSDNVDSNLPLEVVSDTFSGNEHKLGNYQVVVRTKDLSDNYSANKTVNLSIQNKGYSVIAAPKEITVPISSPLTLEAFKGYINVTDGCDGEITNYKIDGFDDYTKTSRTVGTNKVKISYVNSGANLTEAEVTLKKVDDLLPTIKFDSGYFVILAPGETFTLDQFKTQAAKILHVDVEDIIDVKGEYDTATEGEYLMTLCLADESTQEFTVYVGEVGSNTTKFKFTDLFTKFYWTTTWNHFKANIFHFNSWNWMNYVLLIGIVAVIIGSIIGYRKYKKKKK